MKVSRTWRIAAESPDYSANDLSGKGAELFGGRWNRKGIRLVYASSSRALACLESVVHLNADDLPLNRYLVQVDIPRQSWEARTVLDPASLVGWDAQPEGATSLDWGTQWAQSKLSLIAEVPSVIVPEETNLLINPAHPDIGRVVATKVRKWVYDNRLNV